VLICLDYHIYSDGNGGRYFNFRIGHVNSESITQLISQIEHLQCEFKLNKHEFVLQVLSEVITSNST
jgi:hypothetical protein